MTLFDIKNMLKDELFNQLFIDCELPTKHKSNKKILDTLMYKYSSIVNKKLELIYLYKNKNRLEDLHIFCKICGNKNTFHNFVHGYSRFCSPKCFRNDPEVIKLTGDTMFRRFGYRHNWSSPDPKLNGSETCMKLYNVPKYVLANDFQEKERRTNLRKRGVEYAMQSKEVQQKSDKTKRNNIDENGLNSYQRAGIKCVHTKRNDIDENGLDGVQRSILHTIQTIRKTRGVNNISQTQEWKDIMYKKRDQISLKSYNTKKQNHSYKKSKIEDICYNNLKLVFQDAVHCYRDENRYPFNCDLYIPSQDLFIELNFHWTHGKEPFNPNNSNHLKIINNWLSKSKEINLQGKSKNQYLIAINVWTKRDPLKLETFKKNNINYKIFYNKKEFDNWLNLKSN